MEEPMTTAGTRPPTRPLRQPEVGSAARLVYLATWFPLTLSDRSAHLARRKSAISGRFANSGIWIMSGSESPAITAENLVLYSGSVTKLKLTGAPRASLTALR